MLGLKATKPATAQGEPASLTDPLAGGHRSKAIHTTIANQERIDRALTIFEARCDARAILAAEGMIAFQDAVDELQRSAELSGLVDALGIDTVQATMSAAFARYAGFYRA